LWDTLCNIIFFVVPFPRIVCFIMYFMCNETNFFFWLCEQIRGKTKQKRNSKFN
jgi:hypothetical protein